MNKRQKEVLQEQLNNEKEVLKKLEANYQDALDEINSKIELLLARQDADMQHVIYQVEYQKALKTQVQSILETLQANEFETVSAYLTKSYEDGFIGTMYDLQGQGIPLIFPIDQKAVVEAIQTETQLSNDLYTALGKDIKTLQKQIAGEISRGVAGGQMYSEIARNVAGYARIPKNNAMRIVRTEAHRIQTRASMNACEKAKSKGADVVKQWDASLDKRTRESHVRVDGEIRELDEKFSNGLLYPGDPNGSAAEVINCRCALLQRARWALGNDFTKWSPDAPVEISDDGTTQLAVIEAKDYESFKKQYNQATERVRDNVQKMNDEDTNGEKEKQYGIRYGNAALDVDFDEINSNEYMKKFSSITDNESVNDCIYRTSQNILVHCTGTEHEDLYLINASKGTVFASVTNSDVDRGIIYTDEFKDKLKESKKNGIPIIGIHNHPQGTPPSADDFRKAHDNGYAFGVVVGHNGQVYVFETPSFAISEAYAESISNDIAVLVNGGVDIDRACEMVYNGIGLKYTIMKGGDS